nr:Hint domain-containing protein [uncultured Celeribacter sp.]
MTQIDPRLAPAPTAQSPQGPTHDLPVYRAEDFVVSAGVNLREPISVADDLEISDVYTLAVRAERKLLCLSAGNAGFSVAPSSALGTVGQAVHLDCVVTLMSATGDTVEALVMVETDRNGLIDDSYLLPFAQLTPDIDYVLVRIDRDRPEQRLAEVSCVAFTRGTRITLADGTQKPIEALRAGDRVLTRDHGPREIRWIGQQTLRATGAFAPILIKRGALNNENDLTISPNHRLFIYQRRDRLKAGRAEVLVKAKLLVNGQNVIQTEGGYVDYFQILFDSHEIIFAEGIAAESTRIDGHTSPQLPADLQARLHQLQTQAHDALTAFEVTDGMLDPKTALNTLRAASGR